MLCALYMLYDNSMYFCYVRNVLRNGYVLRYVCYWNQTCNVLRYGYVLRYVCYWNQTCKLKWLVFAKPVTLCLTFPTCLRTNETKKMYMFRLQISTLVKCYTQFYTYINIVYVMCVVYVM